jgi:hypothetical protein
MPLKHGRGVGQAGARDSRPCSPAHARQHREEASVIKTFDLVKPATVSEERFLGLAQRARQIAIEIEGVYDLALYQTDGASCWQCSVDVDDEQTWELLQGDENFRRVLDEVRALGVQVVPHGQLERRV